LCPRLAQGLEQLAELDAEGRIYPGVGAPIAQHPAGGAEHAGDGVASQACHLTQDMPSHSLALGSSPRTVHRLTMVPMPSSSGAAFVSTVTGEGGTSGRCAITLALSAMIHSVIFPLRRSKASAMAADMLM